MNDLHAHTYYQSFSVNESNAMAYAVMHIKSSQYMYMHTLHIVMLLMYTLHLVTHNHIYQCWQEKTLEKLLYWCIWKANNLASIRLDLRFIDDH